jgi:hypothetical protein
MTMNAIAAVAGAVLNSLWQSLALTLLVWVALRTVRARVNAATRHAVWWITLAVVVLLPCMPRSGRPAPAAAEARSAQSVPLGTPRWRAAGVCGHDREGGTQAETRERTADGDPD